MDDFHDKDSGGKKDLRALLDEPIENEKPRRRGDDQRHEQQQSKHHPKKPDIKSMLEAAKRAKEAAASREKQLLEGREVQEQPAEEDDNNLEIPIDIPKHHFELEESQAFFDIGSESKKGQKQPQTKQQPSQQIHSPQAQRSQHSQQPPQQAHQHSHRQQQKQGNFPFVGGVVSSSRSWIYRDPKGNEQGPFSSLQMEKWLNAQYVDLSSTFLTRQVFHHRFGSQVSGRRPVHAAGLAFLARTEESFLRGPTGPVVFCANIERFPKCCATGL